MNKTVYKSDIGEYLEGDEWRIIKNKEVYLSDEKFCKHCKITEYDENGKASKGIVPYVVEASAECGYVGTRVCLECILEACNKLSVK